MSRITPVDGTMPNGKRMDVDPIGHMVTPVGDFWAQFLMEDYYHKGFLFGEGGT